MTAITSDKWGSFERRSDIRPWRVEATCRKVLAVGLGTMGVCKDPDVDQLVDFWSRVLENVKQVAETSVHQTVDVMRGGHRVCSRQRRRRPTAHISMHSPTLPSHGADGGSVHSPRRDSWGGRCLLTGGR